ncbi:hypothetical protein GUJ93_ZPchr0004g38893 [Zizania palustris]|uniref:Uncharacterized protein n=1 Tax=Zizania palustris TaxID=103762 RepID=A0A8J5SER9_ZIZPA|nr:hypothetical protein GUJ93_ZPchr0004g38893 [Zizania palustris]
MHRVAMVAAPDDYARGRALAAVIKEKDKESALFLEIRRREKEKGVATTATTVEQLMRTDDGVDATREGMLPIRHQHKTLVRGDIIHPFTRSTFCMRARSAACSSTNYYSIARILPSKDCWDKLEDSVSISYKLEAFEKPLKLLSKDNLLLSITYEKVAFLHIECFVFFWIGKSFYSLNFQLLSETCANRDLDKENNLTARVPSRKDEVSNSHTSLDSSKFQQIHNATLFFCSRPCKHSIHLKNSDCSSESLGFSLSSHAPTLLRRPDRPPPPAPLHSTAPTTPRHALAATVAKKPEEIAAPPPAPPVAESGKGTEKAEKKPKEVAKEPEAESLEMKPEKDTATPAPAAPPPSTLPQARPTVAIGGFAFVPVGSLAADQPPRPPLVDLHRPLAFDPSLSKWLRTTDGECIVVG